MAAQTPDLISVLLGEIGDARKATSEVTQGLFALTVVSLTILVDSKAITRDQVVYRLQEFLDAMPVERRNGRQGLLLRQAIEMFQPDAPPPDPKRLFQVIEGGLSQREQPRTPPRSDPSR